jgi:hypothetical protein
MITRTLYRLKLTQKPRFLINPVNDNQEYCHQLYHGEEDRTELLERPMEVWTYFYLIIFIFVPLFSHTYLPVMLPFQCHLGSLTLCCPCVCHVCVCVCVCVCVHKWLKTVADHRSVISRKLHTTVYRP